MVILSCSWQLCRNMVSGDAASTVILPPHVCMGDGENAKEKPYGRTVCAAQARSIKPGQAQQERAIKSAELDWRGGDERAGEVGP
ncbi:MAG: hypothetical protein ACYC0Y_26580 [Pirellulales bacterium]